MKFALPRQRFHVGTVRKQSLRLASVENPQNPLSSRDPAMTDRGIFVWPGNPGRVPSTLDEAPHSYREPSWHRAVPAERCLNLKCAELMSPITNLGSSMLMETAIDWIR